MANAAIFAQTLSQSLGPARVRQEATTIMNSPDLMKAFGGAAGANATTTGTEKDAEAATRAYAAAHPEASPKDIADYKANLIAGGMGGSDLEQRQYLAERSAALAAGRRTSRLSDLAGQPCRGCDGDRRRRRRTRRNSRIPR